MNASTQKPSALELYDLLLEINKHTSTGTMKQYLANKKPTSLGRLIVLINGLFDEVAEEITQAPYRREERRIEHLEIIKIAQEQTLERIAHVTGNNNSGPILAPGRLEELKTVGILLEDQGVATAAPLDRAEMMANTEQLIASIVDWPIPEYAQKTLILKLNALQRIIQASSTFSDTDVRKKVKEIFADFAAEFYEMDSEYASRMEKIKIWAKSFFVGSSRTLGLTASGVTLTNLLPPPGG